MTPTRHEFDDDGEEFIADIMREIYNKSPLTESEATVYHVSWMMTEVNNGGFHQFFYNKTGDFASDTAFLLRRIGATETAQLVERGCELFPGGTPPADCIERRAILDKFMPTQLMALDDLQEQFYSRSEDLCLMLKSYWEASAETT